MKKNIIILLAASLPMVAQAQFLVDSNGRAAFGVARSESNPLQSRLSIGDYGRSDAYMTITAPNINHGLYITRSGGTPYTSHSVITALNGNLWGLTENYGIYTTAYSSTPINGSCKSYGLYAQAGNCDQGNIGVLGIATSGAGTNFFDVGIYGTNAGVALEQHGKYAGYFNGNVKVSQTITASAFSTNSDYRLKENIEQLDGSQAVDNLMKINTVSYNYRQREVEMADGTMGNYYEENSPVLLNTHYGVIAQELKEIYPDLVIEDASGYLSVNYMELIPILIKSVQELKGQVDALKGCNEKPAAMNAPATTSVSGSLIESLVLYQNTPNPFTENTTVLCDIPEFVSSAVLYIYDATGRQIESWQISQRGRAQVIIEGNSLEAGIYLYSLIADGQIVDTKRMILTK